MNQPLERKLAAIMFTDIAGYTALSAKDSKKTSELLKTQRGTLKPIVEKHGGSWMKEIGDGLLLIFDSATSAVECSIAIQVATKDIEDLNLRIGIHEGEVIKQDGDVIGDDVNVASRIEPFSAVGGVAISQKVQQAISSNTEFETKYIGKPKLKGVSQEVKVYCITSHGLPETDVSKVSAKLEEEYKFNIFALTGGILTTIGVAFWIAVGVFDVSFGGKAEVPSVGILMMENLGKEDEEFWSSGMTADLITKVAGAGLIRVAPLDDILKLDKDLSIEEKAKKLRVKYILTHSFLIKDKGFDLWCKLENTENGVALFSNKISEPIDMAVQMVGKLANDIITSLKVKSKQDVMKAPTNNAEAYEYYLKAKYKWQKRKTIEDIYIVRGLLEKSVEIDKKLITAKHLLAIAYDYSGENKKAYEMTQLNLIESQDYELKNEEANCLSMLGILEKNLGNQNNAVNYFNRALEIYLEVNNQSGIANQYNNLGSIYRIKGEKELAFDNYYKAKILYKKLDDKDGLSRCYNNLATIYDLKGEYDKALYNFNKSLLLAESIGNMEGVAAALGNMGLFYMRQSKLEKALEYRFKSLEIYEKLQNERALAKSYSIIGHNYNIIGDYDKALDYYNKSLDINEKLDDKFGLQSSLGNIGTIYYYKQNYQKAIEYLGEAIELQNENQYFFEIIETIRFNLVNKIINNKYNKEEVLKIIKDVDDIGYYLNYDLFKLLEETSYLETAYNQIQETAGNLEPDVKAKFLSYPIPKAIVEEWEKVK